MRLFVIGCIVLSVICSCRNESKSVYVENLPKIDTFQKLKMQSIPLEHVGSSYVGTVSLTDESILLVDSRFCWIFEFALDGKLKQRYLGQGNAPTDLPAGMIDGYAYLQDGSHFIIGPQNDCYVFDEKFQLKFKYILQRGNRTRTAVDPEIPDNYTLSYFNMGIKNYGDNLYTAVMLDHPTYNFIVSPKEYFRNAHPLMELDLPTGKLKTVKGNYPDTYQKDPSLRHLNFIFYDIDKTGNFYLTYEGDSTIYTFNADFQPLSAYGYAGKDMVKKEAVFHSLKEFRKGNEKNRRERGIYTDLQYIDETGILFRGYQKGEGHVMDGLQIYKDKVLIGDVEVPKNLKILGYIAPYYYAWDGIDEENEKIMIYRFQL